jgi:predicted N-acetyltransferase YhbS
MELKRVEEFQLRPEEEAAVSGLLGSAFSAYPKRSYYKQPPDFRYLAWEGERLIAHMAVEHRTINNSGALLRIFGLADLCVADSHRQKRLASHLLSELSLLGMQHRIDFIVLMATQKQLYLRNGFVLVNNLCRWIMISEHSTLGVAQRQIEATLMVKKLGRKEWGEGLVDFLGPVF